MIRDLEKINVLYDQKDLDILVHSFEKDLKIMMDKHAPLRVKKITTRKKYPWFSEAVKEQKRKVRRKERVWRR